MNQFSDMFEIQVCGGMVVARASLPILKKKQVCGGRLELYIIRNKSHAKGH
jgi:hypothetical protein